MLEPRGRAGGCWDSRMGVLRWSKETWIQKEVGGSSSVRKEGAVAWIGKALEHRIGTSGRGRRETNFEPRWEWIPLEYKGLPPQRRHRSHKL